MGKTTICDGEILFTSKKDTLIHAFDGDLEFDAVGKNQWKGSETEIGDYVPTAIGEENKNFIACIDFYRSLDNSNGAFGSADKTYTGQFGFDRFDKKVCGEGTFGDYEVLSTIIPNDKINSKTQKYLCSYLTIWPPNIEGNTDNAKSKITLYVKASLTNKKSTKDIGQIEFTSSDSSNITVSANTELTIKGPAKPITIECKGSFDKDIEITAKAKDEPQILGKLIIKANHNIYVTTIHPVEVEFVTAGSPIITDIALDDKINKIIQHFNTKSFNQAYIYARVAPSTKMVLSTAAFQAEKLFFEKDKETYLDYDKGSRNALKYQELVVQKYAAYKQNKEPQRSREERMNMLIKQIIKVFQDNFSYDAGDIDTAYLYHKTKKVQTLWDTKAKPLYEKYLLEKKEYGNVTPLTLDIAGKTYFFYTKNIEMGTSSADFDNKDDANKVQAFSLTGSSTAQIFNHALEDEKSAALVIHELAHGYGLQHTFDKDDQKKYNTKQEGHIYKKEIENEINDIKKTTEKFNSKIEKLEKIAKKDGKTASDYQGLLLMDTKYVNLKNAQKKADSVDFTNFERDFLQYILDTLTLKNWEGKEYTTHGATNYENTALEQITKVKLVEEQEKIKQKQTKVAELEKQAKAAETFEEYERAKGKSLTLENYVDYRQKEGEITMNPDFEYKSFYQWQWKYMQENNEKSLVATSAESLKLKK